MTINDLLPEECTLVKRHTSDFNWNLAQAKHTLKEFEKPIYYSNGDYRKAYTNKFSKNLLTGNIKMDK